MDLSVFFFFDIFLPPSLWSFSHWRDEKEGEEEEEVVAIHSFLYFSRYTGAYLLIIIGIEEKKS